MIVFFSNGFEMVTIDIVRFPIQAIQYQIHNFESENGLSKNIVGQMDGNLLLLRNRTVLLTKRANTR